jgi:hypothetical protein
MKGIRFAFALAIAVISFAIALVAAGSGSGRQLPPSVAPTAAHGNGWSVELGRAVPAREPSSVPSGAALGRRQLAALNAIRASSTPSQRLGLQRQGAFVHVALVVRRGQAGALVDRIRVAGGRVEVQQGDLVQARVRASEVRALAADSAVVRVEPTAEFVPSAITGEGLSATNASEWQPHGLVGTGVKVAVFDFGFAGLAEKQAAGEIPKLAGTADFSGGSFNGPEKHGTAVAEIVAEEAPGVQLYLVCIDTVASLAQAEAWAKANGINVINMSGGFLNTWRGDGNGPAGTPDAIVADARANGILWVNSAGNEAMSHWGGAFVSNDGDPFHDFAPGDAVDSVVVPNGEVVCGFLRWDEWPVASDDFDLGLYNDGQFVAVSDADQSGGGLRPTEALCVRNTSGVTKKPGFVIARYSGNGTPTFDLFVTGDPYDLVPQFSTAARSIVDPAASPNVLSVGADCWQTGGLEPYSSQGPTIDNRMKPDLVAPDSVSSATYGAFTMCGMSGFAGTSASSPYVAGAAALLKQRYPRLRAPDLQQWLVKNAVDAGQPGPESQYGAGKLALTTLPQAIVKALPASGSYGRNVKLSFRLTGEQWQLREHVHVFRGSRQISTHTLPFRSVPAGSKITVTWKAPSLTPRSTFRFVVEAWDKAGDASKRTWARINLR